MKGPLVPLPFVPFGTGAALAGTPGLPTPFRRVAVDHLVRGRTRVSWWLDPGFCPCDPWLAKLQWGHTGSATADDWADVADFVQAPGTLIDEVPRDDRGEAWRVHYRVVVRACGGDAISPPASTLGVADQKHWLQAQAIVRKERLRMRQAGVSRGWLFKRKREGVRPPVADRARSPVSFLTGDITRPKAPETVGTEFVGGYYDPVPFQVDFSPAGTRSAADASGTRGTVDDLARPQHGRVVLDPPLAQGDVYVATGSDERFVVNPVRYLGISGRLPILADVEFRLAPRSDIAYTLAVPDVDPFPGGP